MDSPFGHSIDNEVLTDWMGCTFSVEVVCMHIEAPVKKVGIPEGIPES